MSNIVNLLTIESVLRFSNAILSIAHKTIDYPEPALAYYSGIFSPAAIESKLSNCVALYIEENNDIKGVMWGTMPEGGVSTIVWLLVAESSQKKGYGKLLFDEAISRYKATNTHKIKLTVPNKNTLEFYKKLGMNEEGFHQDHWWNMDVFSMAMKLR